MKKPSTVIIIYFKKCSTFEMFMFILFLLIFKIIAPASFFSGKCVISFYILAMITLTKKLKSGDGNRPSQASRKRISIRDQLLIKDVRNLPACSIHFYYPCVSPGPK